MKTIFGNYELTKKQMDRFIEAIAAQFDLDLSRVTVLHPLDIGAGHRHIDVLIPAYPREESPFVSFGCSAKRLRMRVYHSPEWFSPFVEVFLKLKELPSDDLKKLYSNLLREACHNDKSLDPSYELCVLDGYNYAFFDGYEEYHALLGYWGVLIKPGPKVTVAGVGEVQFYQLIPAYRSELEFVERHGGEVNYKELCRALTERLEERQYFDVSYPQLTSGELEEVLNTVRSLELPPENA